MPKPRCAHCGAFTKPFSRDQLAAVESEITLLVRDELKKAYPNKHLSRLCNSDLAVIVRATLDEVCRERLTYVCDGRAAA